MHSPSALLALLPALLLACGPEVDAWPRQRQGLTALEEVTGFGSDPGNLRMLRHVPTGMPAKAGLLVALHGCTQAAADFEADGFSAVADERKFYVLYPEQRATNNPLRCFNWSGEGADLANLQRGQGENLSIKQMVDRMKADFSIDPARVFVTGVSAGGAQTALMLATWPDVFAGGAVIAGVPYDCAHSLLEANACGAGRDLSAAEWAKKVKDAFPAWTGPWPRVSIWQGNDDLTVRPANRQELVDQWTGVHGIDGVADQTQALGAHTRRAYQDAAGVTRVEAYELVGTGHGVPVDPANGCGTAGAFALDVKLCAASRIADFFGLGAASAPQDAGDAGVGSGTDGGTSPDGGTAQPQPATPVSCHCQGVPGGVLAALGALALLLRRAGRASR